MRNGLENAMAANPRLAGHIRRAIDAKANQDEAWDELSDSEALALLRESIRRVARSKDPNVGMNTMKFAEDFLKAPNPTPRPGGGEG